MAKARAAKAEKAAAKKPEPEMEIVEREVTETTHKTTPTGQEKTKTTRTVYRPVGNGTDAEAAAPAAAAATVPPAADTAEPAPEAEPTLNAAEQAAVDRAGQGAPRKKRGLFIVIGILVLIAAVAAYVFTSDPDVGSGDPAAADVETIIEGDNLVGGDELDDEKGDGDELLDDDDALEDDVLDSTAGDKVEEVIPPVPAPVVVERQQRETLQPDRRVIETGAPPPSPERNLTAYVMRPFGDRRDDFIVYDFDFNRVCVTNSSERAELPQTGCMAYESLSDAWREDYDQLCRRYYAFAEVCPADITEDVVWRELEYHQND